MKSLYQRLKDELEAIKCPDCRGLGRCDDAESGDIAYHEWYCTRCRGMGITDPARLVVTKTPEITEKCCVLVKSKKRLGIVEQIQEDKIQIRFVGNNVVDFAPKADVEYWGPGENR